MDFLKLLHEFVKKVVIRMCVCDVLLHEFVQVILCLSRPLPKPKLVEAFVLN